jgi:RpiB/LacA/LacB family sugar-phosphate isomerase
MNVIQTGGQPFVYTGVAAVAAEQSTSAMKGNIEDYFRECSVKFVDCGISGSYTDSVLNIAETILNGSAQRGIVITENGEAACSLANRLKNIRCVYGDYPSRVILGRQENDVNVCVVDMSVIGFGVAMESVWKFLATDFLRGDFERILRQIEGEDRK